MIAVIDQVIEETPDTKTFRLVLEDENCRRVFDWEPGQFVELTVFGAGEAPIGFASSPLEKSWFEITVVARGKVTRALHRLQKGDKVGIRGPLGNCWPLQAMKGQNVLIVSGGCGVAPLRPVILYILANRKDYGDFWLLYGARTPHDCVFKCNMEEWSQRPDVKVLQTVDVPDSSWQHRVGVVTTLLNEVDIDPSRTVALVCGPPIMIKFAILDLLRRGLDEERIVTSLERYMKCGVGKCGHCCINHVYLCTEGPVFTYQQIKMLPELQL
jgi:NAD(P)H-flavin reductase